MADVCVGKKVTCVCGVWECVGNVCVWGGGEG